VRQDRIRWRKLLVETERALGADGARKVETRELLRPARELLDEARFWQYQSDGLAMFSGPGWSRFFRVAVPLPELGVVGRRFVIGPLLPLLSDGGHFFVLAVSQNEIGLLQGTRFGLETVELRDPPRASVRRSHMRNSGRRSTASWQIVAARDPVSSSTVRAAAQMWVARTRSSATSAGSIA
jgi:hypothetical protein